MITNYHSAIILTKCTNLLPWFESAYRDRFDSCSTSVGFNQFKHRYAQDREVQLILLVRYDNDPDGKMHTYCKIRCPINPLPIRGEFEVVSLTRIIKHLEGDGWKYNQKLPISLLK